MAADADIQNLIEQVREAVELKAGANFAEYKAIQVSKQVVAGTNYFVKVHVGGDCYVHVRIYKPLPGQGDLQVHGVQSDKTLEDSLAYF